MKIIFQILQEEPDNLFSYIKSITKEPDDEITKLVKKFKEDYERIEQPLFKYITKK